MFVREPVYGGCTLSVETVVKIILKALGAPPLVFYDNAEEIAVIPGTRQAQVDEDSSGNKLYIFI